MTNVPDQLGNDWPLRTPGNARTGAVLLQASKRAHDRSTAKLALLAGAVADSSWRCANFMARYILQRLMLLPLLMVIFSFMIFAICRRHPVTS